MPTKLVDDVRGLISARVEEVPFSAPERALLITAVSRPGIKGQDVVDELEQAIHGVQRAVAPSDMQPAHRAAIARLMKASRAILDYEPPEPPKPPAPLPEAIADQRRRADVDG